VTEAGSLDQADVIAALDHAQIAEGPGGPAAMVPGQHTRESTCTSPGSAAAAWNCRALGAIDPQERPVALAL
jgi:branched-chain amino acid transport system substrate-binding protein